MYQAIRMEWGKNLYSFTTICEEKYNDSNKTSQTLTKPNKLDASKVAELQSWLTGVCALLKQQIAQAQEIDKKETCARLESETLNVMIQRVYAYLTTLIQIHKSSSFCRFINLFSSHATFLNRLNYVLNKFTNSEAKKTAQSFVETIFHPDITLLETKRHRKTQGKHLNEESKRKYHKHLEETIDHLKSITIEDKKHDLINYEAAHEIPFPAIFARRKFNHMREELDSNSDLKSYTISREYLSEPDKDKRERLFRQDVDTLFLETPDEPLLIIDKVMDLLTQVSLQEVSHTYHVPSIFNQEVDGVSEKYIDSQEPEDLVLLKWNQAWNSYYYSNSADAMPTTTTVRHTSTATTTTTDMNTTTTTTTTSATMTETSKSETLFQKKAKDKTHDEFCTYTEKIYKYMLSRDLFKMIQSINNGKQSHSIAEVMQQEENYIVGVKLALARKIKELASQPIKTLLKHDFGNFILQCLFWFKK